MTLRSRSLAALVLLLGLAALFAAGADAAPRKKKNAGPVRPAGDTTAVIAVVDGHAITRAMAEARLKEIPEQFRSGYQTPAGRQQLIDRLIEERIWITSAEKAKVDQRPDIKDQLERQRRDLLVRTYLNEQIAKAPPVSDSTVRAYYDAHLDDYKTPANVTIQHILLPDRSTALRVKALADKGGDWAKLVQKYSTDSLTKSTGGALGTVTMEGNFASIGHQPALAESAFALGEGKIGGPFKTDHGWHVVKVTAVTPAGTRTFDQMKSLIQRQLDGQAQKAYYQELLKQARKSLNVQEDSAAVRDYVSMKRTPREQFEDAQKIGPAEQRIKAYRQLVEQYPHAEVSPQALFMVGFINSEELKNYDEAGKVFRELLTRYPKSELVDSARWMLEHMRSDEAPPFATAGGDSTKAAASKGAKSP